MSPADPLEQLLTGAFNRELNELENPALIANVMKRVRRNLRLRNVALTVATLLAMLVMATTFPDLTWLAAWLQDIEIGNLSLPIVLPLLVCFVPWLLVLLDDQV